MLAESNLRKLPKYNRRITLDLRNELTGYGLTFFVRLIFSQVCFTNLAG